MFPFFESDSNDFRLASTFSDYASIASISFGYDLVTIQDSDGLKAYLRPTSISCYHEIYHDNFLLIPNTLAMSVPISPYELLDGMVYFRRMLDKAWLFSRGELRQDLHSNLGLSMDAWTCELLGVDYSSVVSQAIKSMDDDSILFWCYSQGKRPTSHEKRVWNAFMTKVGWRDSLSEKLSQRKAESGLSHRDDIQTMFDYIDADEGRHPGDAFMIN